MKKQILILTATLVTVAFISCSKEKIETQQQNNPEEITALASRPPSGPVSSLGKGLLGLYEFNGDLLEKSGPLETAVTSMENFSGVYTTDRKGMRNRAIKFNGRYIIYIHNVPHSPKMSMAAWVRYDDASVIANFISSVTDGPKAMQVFNEFAGYNNNAGNPYIFSGAVDSKWHHIAVTIDGMSLRFYVDGNFVASTASPDVDPDMLGHYVIGYGQAIPNYWHGAVDELRFYNRTLTNSEVQALYNL